MSDLILPDDDVVDDGEGGSAIFPWPDVEASRRNERLQRAHPQDAAEHYRQHARSCPRCGAGPASLAWFWFESPDWTWRDLCGRAGWMSVCDPCGYQVEFFLEILN